MNEKNHKRLVIILLTLFIITILLINAPYIGNVRAQNNNSYPIDGVFYVGGPGQGNYSSIQNAIDEVTTTNKTIFIYAGTYREQLSINKTLNLTGQNPDKTILKNFDHYHNAGISIQKASYVNITNLTIDWGGNAVGIQLYSTSNVNISNCIIHNNWIGIRGMRHWANGASPRDTIVSNSVIKDNELGLTFWSSSNTRVENNLIYDNHEGIDMSEGDDVDIINNAIFRNKRGISFDEQFGYSLYITNNSFMKNGVDVYDGGVRSLNCYGGGNYWDNYHGEDNNNDGVGDVPYTVNNRTIDRSPLINPPVEVSPIILSYELIYGVLFIISVMVLIIIAKKRNKNNLNLGRGENEFSTDKKTGVK